MIKIAWTIQIIISVIFSIAAYIAFHGMEMNKGLFILLIIPIGLPIMQMCKILLVKYIYYYKKFWKKFIFCSVLFFIMYEEFSSINWFVKIYLDQSLSIQHYAISFLIVVIAPLIAFIGMRNN